jgi:hypothetical protein
MKLSECRPCDKCGGKISPTFYVIRFTQALFTPNAGRTLAMTQYLGNNLELGELFAPESDDAILVLGDQNKHLMEELLICQPCFLDGPLDLASLSEKRNNQIEEQRQKQEASVKGGNEE